MIKLQKLGGVAALAEAIVYVASFVFFGAFWHFPNDAAVIQKLAFLADNQILYSMVNLVMYIVFGMLLAVLVTALHQRMKDQAPVLSQIASIFGLIWVGLVIASGMIANIGLASVIKLSSNAPEQAWTVWLAINAIVEGLGGGNEVVGGLWVLLLSVAALKCKVLPNALNYCGLLIGFAGIATVYPVDVLTELFGLGQVLWFLGLGSVLLRNSQTPGT